MTDFPEKVWGIAKRGEFLGSTWNEHTAVEHQGKPGYVVQPYFSAQCMEELVEAGDCTVGVAKQMLDQSISPDEAGRIFAEAINGLEAALTHARSLLEVKG
jgi:hypothetical protein